ncbi:YbaK/aminoacyl-tRNA synthetase-associated domain-containing protein [Perilla frutescens var. hirtella]|uniref:YbaK/aminoacyl-tRNA synthetase-associated domain-containing protein n=1 Tax=Perilla frutescens var. hirtella TaxID=608512 RepID=A0AAD4PBA3_PERFH|nr:YbaK/aminoacyl-tRNA synthetase-associated domain-containing protein [Perilla frutescens var. hirtella]
MAFTKEQLLARLQELQIGFSQYEHPVVLTVEAQAKYVGNMKGALSKNLFLKDKKQRYYIVSALANTKVDLKVLSQRLGLGKGGLRMAPEEALSEILHVPLGCVTPFALVNESARHVSLLLDKGFKSQECCFFHPLSNDMSIALNALDLDKFLNSIGKTPAYVDLEDNPTVGKDQPPDLASFVPSDAKTLADPPEKQESSQGPEKNYISVNNKPVITTGAKPAKPSNASTKEKPFGAVNMSITYADPDKFVEEILEKTRSIVLSEVKEEENVEKYREQLETIVSNKISKQLGMELKNLATIFKNTAYTEGFKAGIHQQPKRL